MSAKKTLKEPTTSVLTNETKAHSKRASPFADFYELWNQLGRKDVSQPQGLFDVLKGLAEASQREYFHSPIPLPGPAEQKLRDLLVENVAGKTDEELSMRRKTLHQFKYYLRNQVKNRSRVHDMAYEGWRTALQKFEGEVAWACQGQMSRTTYRPKTVDAIFDAATSACEALWGKHQLKVTALPTPTDLNELIELKVRKLAAKPKFKGRQDIIDAYRATLRKESIKPSDYAKSIGASCDQTKGIFTFAGREKPYHISPDSIMAWLVIRLLMESPAATGITTLYAGWDGTFGNSKDDKTKFKQSHIVCTNSDARKNGKRFRLVAIKKSSR